MSYCGNTRSGDVENTSRGMVGAGHTKANVNSSRKSGKTAKYDAILSRIAYVRRYKVSVYGCIRFFERKLMCSPRYRGDVLDVLNPPQAQYLCGNLCCCVAASGTAKTASFRGLWFRPSSLTRQHRHTEKNDFKHPNHAVKDP